MSLDLNKLANKLDEALSNETTETLTKFLNDKRMSNNKQTWIDWFFDQLEEKGDLRETPSIRNVQLNIDTSDYMELKQQAREMYRDEIEAAAIISSAEQSTKAANQKTEAFAIGYDQGYNRALDLIEWKIKTEIRQTIK